MSELRLRRGIAQMESRLEVLQARKKTALADEDYDQAKSIKAEVDALLAEKEKEEENFREATSGSAAKHDGTTVIGTTGEKVSLYFGGTARFKDDELEDIIRSSVLPSKRHEMPSISNKTKAAKDALEADPYNIELIRDLGLRYSAEVQHDKAANVMLRGWKRASELKDAQDRFTFLMKLCEASFRNKQFRQAQAIIMDIDEPEDYYEKKAYQLLSCHTHAEVGDAPRALSIFSKAIDGEEFESAIKIWAACALRLKKVGAFEAAKNAVMNKARSGQNYHMDQSRMQTVESWAIMSQNPDEPKSMLSFEDGIPPVLIKGAIAATVLIFIFLLWLAERSSLSTMKLSG